MNSKESSLPRNEKVKEMKPEAINKYFKTKKMLEKEIKDLEDIGKQDNKTLYLINKRVKLLERIEDKLFEEMERRYC